MKALIVFLLSVICYQTGFSQNTITIPFGADQKIVYNLDTGKATYISFKTRINNFYSEAKIPNTISSKMYKTRTHRVSGDSTIVTNTSPDLPTMHQIFIADNENQLHMIVTLEGKEALSTNYIAPIVAKGKKALDISYVISNPRVIIMPSIQQNTMRWKYPSINSSGLSYGVTAFYENENRHGTVIGALTHDNWRTGIQFSGNDDTLNNLEVICGVKSERDVVEHGEVTGKTISSATIFVGSYQDYRDGLESFGKAMAALTPRESRATSLTHDQNTVLSWKSWGNGANKKDNTLEKLFKVSDRIKDSLETKGFENNQGKVVVQLAGMFLKQFTREEHFKFAQHVKANNQIPGWYNCTWLYPGWARDDTKVTPTSKWTFGDIALRDDNGGFLMTPKLNGKVQKSLDPTHPGTLERFDYLLKEYIAQGFEYIRLDFAQFGAVEGNYYNKEITTGVQAYNYGMRYIHKILQGKVHVNLAISPYFPYQYAHSRRISGDTKYTFETVEYELNALAGGWWLGNGILYDNLDPGDVDFHKEGEHPNIAMSKVNGAAITGFCQSSDDWLDDHRFGITQKYFTNPDVLKVLNKGKSFRPLDIDSENTPNVFYLKEEGTDAIYVAVFNHTTNPLTVSFDFNRMVKNAKSDFKLFDLWTKEESVKPSSGNWTFDLVAKGSKLYKVNPIKEKI
ncbi:hypothetical protein FPF71_08050 [Algibacter amylolyticus]|uniref:Alpha galactosidase C-terminal domain-containing protein n=1 Tax=Algibacter amylolyticus TaxID=1608400 RepID=A0A5M7B9Y9_9FLAO|nr:hypothetical protein [Algibacter amylolyticus]KAA5825138.1 hypothetical protein F2B50_08050 [Algibacter amylolyticus]MBB5268754.1 virulence-associated protein VapD [Algibacter amylolyticus]TSJ77632.1 hypothetical protein FPF71_08050 [Algibacter amylolyticus]